MTGELERRDRAAGAHADTQPGRLTLWPRLRTPVARTLASRALPGRLVDVILQFAKALYLQERSGLRRFVSMQNHYNLLYLEEKREMLPLCAAEGISVTPWSPLAHARSPATGTRRRSGRDRDFGMRLYRDSDTGIVEAVARVAERRGASRARVASAWVADKSVVAFRSSAQLTKRAPTT